MKFKKFIIFFSALTIFQQGLEHVANGQKSLDQKQERTESIRIIEEKGPAGHQTIGIDESSMSIDVGKELLLTFKTLMLWSYDAQENFQPPMSIKKLDGQKVRIIGFMFPLQEGKMIKNFCLLRTTQTCCYGPRPEYNQYIFVEMAKPTTFHRLDPVSCVGKLRVEPNPEEGYIYRMEGEYCVPAIKK